jgi:hypothetical protein
VVCRAEIRDCKLIVKCHAVGKLDPGAVINFQFTDGAKYLSKCGPQSGVTVICEDPRSEC